MRPPAVEINSFSSYPKNTHLLFILAPKGFLDIPLICPGRRALEIWGSARGKHMHLLRSLRILYQKLQLFSLGRVSPVPIFEKVPIDIFFSVLLLPL